MRTATRRITAVLTLTLAAAVSVAAAPAASACDDRTVSTINKVTKAVNGQEYIAEFC